MTGSPMPGPTLEQLSQLLIEFYEKMSSWEHEVVKETGISLAQMHTIEIIGHNRNRRMKEIAQKMGVTTGSLTVMIDRLEKNGLVQRHPHPDDRRSLMVTLTPKGNRYHAEHHNLHLALTREITSTFSEQEIKQLLILMGKLMEQF
jgi:DNA-binding MarR family transcriptional regulator